MNISILTGDNTQLLRFLPNGYFHCCVTSPPYFGLRDYGMPGQIGLEETPQEYIDRLVVLFREVWRVLRDDGTLWLNLGDTYNNNPSTSNIPRTEQGNGSGAFQIPPEKHLLVRRAKPNKAQPLIDIGIKKKDLIGIPWRVALALQADGWYLRQDIIWHKPNPMPESVTDRCTKSHEYIFLLSKSQKYYFDADAIKEPSVITDRTRGPALHRDAKSTNGNSGLSQRPVSEFRNKRDVWTISTKPFKGAHFATFPPDLIEPCIKAGAPFFGNVLDPFGGSGTTGLVARNNFRNAMLLELNPEYVAIARERLGL